MEAPIFTQKLGTGKWIGTTYTLDICPLCSGNQTMKFTGKGMWGCTKCKKGGVDLSTLREFMKGNPLFASIIPSIVDPTRPEGLIVVSEYHNPYKGSVIGTGFSALDFLTGGLTEGAMTIVTGKRAEGKSSWLGQTALNAIQGKHNVCFYSGELSAGRFQSWLFTQAAGTRNLEGLVDQFGATRWAVKAEADAKIRQWLGDKMVLYDNSNVKSSERRTILKCFNYARAYYGSDLFIADNLMTARYDIDNDQDTLRAQANFASEMMDFARENNVHVILVAHPRKGDSEDINDSVAGFGDITNMATNVIQVKRVNNTGGEKYGCDAIITVAKNREYGDTGSVEFKYDKQSKRFLPLTGGGIAGYGWEK